MGRGAEKDRRQTEGVHGKAASGVEMAKSKCREILFHFSKQKEFQHWH